MLACFAVDTVTPLRVHLENVYWSLSTASKVKVSPGFIFPFSGKATQPVPVASLEVTEVVQLTSALS